MLSPKISNSLIDGFEAKFHADMASQGFRRGVSYQVISPSGEGSRTMDVVRGGQLLASALALGNWHEIAVNSDQLKRRFPWEVTRHDSQIANFYRLMVAAFWFRDSSLHLED